MSFIWPFLSGRRVDLRNDTDAYVILQFGRVGTDAFTMDVQHPMSLLQVGVVGMNPGILR